MRQPYPPKMGHDGRAMDAELAGERVNGLTIYAFLEQLVDLNSGQPTLLRGWFTFQDLERSRQR